jgi:hypothetical protein
MFYKPERKRRAPLSQQTIQACKLAQIAEAERFLKQLEDTMPKDIPTATAEGILEFQRAQIRQLKEAQ